MGKIIEPVSREELIAELNKCKLIKQTSRKDNEIYSFTYKEAPLLMYEVARLRGEALRAAGCGTGGKIDMDEQDRDPGAYRQLIVWNPVEKEIIGGYRYAAGENYIKQTHLLSVSHYFRFSKKFISDYLPDSIEFGRTWINPLYQPSGKGRQSIYALNNLWEGIGAVIYENKNIKYLYGKVTIHGNYNPIARMLLSWFLDHYFKDNKKLMKPHDPVISPEVLTISGTQVTGNHIEEDFRNISLHIKSLGTVVPPMISACLRLSKKMITFGTARNHELGNSFETGILIAVEDIHQDKYSRYIGPYKKISVV